MVKKGKPVTKDSGGSQSTKDKPSNQGSTKSGGSKSGSDKSTGGSK